MVNSIRFFTFCSKMERKDANRFENVWRQEVTIIGSPKGLMLPSSSSVA